MPANAVNLPFNMILIRKIVLNSRIIAFGGIKPVLAFLH
jgi:hypothetical protein